MLKRIEEKDITAMVEESKAEAEAEAVKGAIRLFKKEAENAALRQR